MTKLMSFEKAIKEMKNLRSYILLVQNYPTETIKQQIIKEYAFTNSVAKVVKTLNEQGYNNKGKPIDHEFVLEVIKSRASDDLHKIIKKGYLEKTRPNRINRN